MPWKRGADGSSWRLRELARWVQFTVFFRERGRLDWPRVFGLWSPSGAGRKRGASSRLAIGFQLRYLRRKCSSILGSMLPPLMMATFTFVFGSWRRRDREPATAT